MGKEAQRIKQGGSLHFNRTERLRTKYGLNNRFGPFDLPGLSSALSRRDSPLRSTGKPFIGHKIVSAEELARIKRIKEVTDPLYILKSRK